MIAGLTWNVSAVWTYDPNIHPNLTEDDEIWTKLDIDSGVVLLDDTYSKQMNLPVAQRFPWDHTKGIYLLNVYHGLHCLVCYNPRSICSYKPLTTTQRNIRGSLREFSMGLPQSEDWEHISHCINSLREDLMCQADDTPRWTGYAPMISGVDQVRQCRDWKQLEAWTKERNACHKHGATVVGEPGDQLEKWTYCPPGSPYLEKIRKFYPNAGAA